MSLGAKADDVSFTAEQRSAILRKIAELDYISSASVSLSDFARFIQASADERGGGVFSAEHDAL